MTTHTTASLLLPTKCRSCYPSTKNYNIDGRDQKDIILTTFVNIWIVYYIPRGIPKYTVSTWGEGGVGREGAKGDVVYGNS